MNPNDETAIADFLKAGGRVCHVMESVRVTESELLDYLASCGIAAKYSPGDLRAYMCQGKRISASKLIKIANEHRRSLQLPPFALRVSIRYAGRSALSPDKK
jgi:hypothetical protein